MEAQYAGADRDQRTAIDKIVNGGGPEVSVIGAAAGSGKTRVLTVAYSRLVLLKNMDPRRIVLTTFTRKAANEILERLAPMLPPGGLQGARVSTFHGLALSASFKLFPGRFPRGRLVDGSGRDADVSSDREIWRAIVQWPGFDYGAPKMADGRHASKPNPIVPGTTLPGLGICGSPDFPETAELTPGDWQGFIDNHLRSRGIEDPNDPRLFDRIQELRDIGEGAPPMWREAWTLYRHSLAGQRAYDFSDILAAWHEALGQRAVDSADVVLVDEAQDNNLVQLQIAHRLAKHGRGRLFLIGDGRQAIYGWRGAAPEFFTEAPSRLGAEIIPMANNYRSGSLIVQAGNVTVRDKDYTLGTTAAAARDGGAFAGVARAAVAADEDGEAAAVAAEIQAALEVPGATPSNYAVLARSAVTLGRYQVAMILAGIPCAIVARNARPFFARPEVRAVVDYLALTETWDPEAWGRVYLEPRRWLSPQWAEGVADEVATRVRRGAPYSVEVLASAIEEASGALLSPGTKARKGADALATAFRELQAARETSSEAAKMRVCWMWLPDSGVGATQEMWEAAETSAQEESDRASERMAAILMTAGLLERFGTARALSTFAARCRDEVPEVTGENEAVPTGRVTLSTVHGSKGLEWPVVYVSCTDGAFPSIRDSVTPHRIEEARRLFYVAETRARDTLVFAYSTTLRGKPAGPSHFADEVMRELQIGPWRRDAQAPADVLADDPDPDGDGDGDDDPLTPEELWSEAVEELDASVTDGDTVNMGVEDLSVRDIQEFLEPLRTFQVDDTDGDGLGVWLFRSHKGETVRVQFPVGADGTTGYRPGPIRYAIGGVNTKGEKALLKRLQTLDIPYPSGQIPRNDLWRTNLFRIFSAL